MKYFSFLFIAFLTLSACNNEKNQSAGNDQSPAAKTENTETNAIEHLKENAVPENDYHKRVKNSFLPLQEEFRKAKGVVPGIGTMHVYVDKFYTLMLKNEIDGDVFETKVSLKHLNPNNGGMSLIPDREPGEFPAVRLHVLSGREGVEIWKNGELISEEDALTIYLPDRKSVEKITPAIAQALNIVHKKVE